MDRNKLRLTQKYMYFCVSELLCASVVKQWESVCERGMNRMQAINCICVVCAIKRFKVIVYYIYIDTLNASTRSRAIPLNQLWHAPTFLCFSTAAGMLMRKNVHFMADI